ncbi:MAG: ATP-binding cassette domain-containing protein [candidate division KSB1 bacterium]|nr:ATP-binding cassette domain-containing protein [candidate division KSB1 bacterium]MDZ7366233.1 ATP-binding cassette domain-containing protein [candidate division KSB1 bacterium]MDZ7404451.1 ATP-binding cassette domain-containing protein [candidate division KSB1 bacterium]
MNIRFEKVWFAYENLSGIPTNWSTSQLQDISFEIRPGELVGIVGRSGSGKTTLMQLFNGLLLPARGRIVVDAQDINSSDYDLVALRRRLGVVFQFPETQLFAATVEEEIAFGPQQQQFGGEEITLRVTEALQAVGLDEAVRKRNPFTLSQGEKRRVALASVLAMRPETLVLDEPTASLDAAGVQEVRRILQKWHAAKKTLVIISHDIDLIASLCRRILVLERGSLLFDGETKALWESAQPHEILRRAGLPLPRTERLRRRLAAKFHF